jgi:hypothetical protein
MPAVSTSTNGLTTISDGTTSVLLKDMRDGGHAVDQVVMATQNGAQIYGGTIGGDQTILNGEWGDPHVRNQVYTGAANTALTQALNALHADAADGRIDDLGNYNKAVGMMANAATAGQGGRTVEIMDLQADHVLVNGSMSIAVDCEALNSNVAFAENAKITFADGSEQTITNIWNRTGQDGALGVRESQAGDGGQSKGTFVVANADEMGHAGSTHLFGAAHGSVYKYVLDVAGNFNGSVGSVGKFWSHHSAMAELGLGVVGMFDRFNRPAAAAPEQRRRPEEEKQAERARG